MNTNIIEKIESLPPLPKTIMDIEDFRQQPDKEAADLLKIIEKDALIVSTLLKVSNSAMFGFRSKVETASKAINLLGINFTISIAIGGTIHNILKTNLAPYGINSDDFMRVSNIATTLASLWLNRVSPDLKEEMVLPALLQEVGKFVLADVISADGKNDDFMRLLNEKTITEAEEEIVSTTTSKVTADIFKHWKLSTNLIKMIENVDDLNNCDSEYLRKTEILDVIKTICNVKEPLSDKSIEKGIAKAKSYNLDIASLESAIEKLQERLIEE